MRYLGITVGGEKVDLGAPVKARLASDENAPADCFSGTFSNPNALPEFRLLEVYDGEILRFGGIVDRQKTECSANGLLVSLDARSYAALLLDSEARPQTYENPSLGKLFAEHGRIYGLAGFLGKTSSFLWTYVIQKGVSEWQVFSDFCSYCLGITPRVTPEGILDATGVKPAGLLRFSNQDGIRYTSVMHDRKPCKRLSHLYLQESLGAGYTSELTDRESAEAGIYRVRYSTAANWQGKQRLQNGKRSGEGIVLTCPGKPCGELGMSVVLEDPVLGKRQNMTLASSVYTVDRKGERWTATLRPVL